MLTTFETHVTGLPGLVVCASTCHAADRGSISRTDECFRTIRTVCPELEYRFIRVTVGDLQCH